MFLVVKEYCDVGKISNIYLVLKSYLILILVEYYKVVEYVYLV